MIFFSDGDFFRPMNFVNMTYDVIVDLVLEM